MASGADSGLRDVLMEIFYRSAADGISRIRVETLQGDSDTLKPVASVLSPLSTRIHFASNVFLCFVNSIVSKYCVLSGYR
jgi:hypothetical protein